MITTKAPPARRARRGLILAAVVASSFAGLAPTAADAAVPTTAPTLTSTKTSFVRGEAAAFTSVVPRPAGQATATGATELLVDGTPVAGPTTLVSAKARFTLRTLTVGTHEVTAHFLGDGASYPEAWSLPLTVQVSPGATTTTVGVRTDPVPSGKAAVISAKATRVAPATGGTLAGTMTFTATPESGPAVVADVPAGTTGSAQWRPKLADGAWAITASYAGNGDFAGSASTARTIAVGARPPAVDQENQAAAASSLGIARTYVTIDLAQTFTAGTTGNVVGVDLQLSTVGDPGPLTVSIQEVDGNGFPTGTVLGSGSFAPADVGPYNTFGRVTLSTPAPIVAGTSYAIVLIVDQQVDGTQWYAIASNDAYAGGTAMNRINGGTWNDFGRDLVFRTFVQA